MPLFLIAVSPPFRSYSNNKVKPILGYSPEELVGKNVKMLMTGQDKQNHDNYLSSYLTTGVAKVVGKPYRRVVASCKDGRLIAVALSVNVQLIGNDRYFTGVLSVVEEEPAASQSVMQLQRDLIDSLPVPALICDEGGAYLAVVWLAMLGGFVCFPHFWLW